MLQTQLTKYRCPFCRKPLREDGYCENEDCADYKRTQLHDEALEQLMQEESENAGGGGTGNNDNPGGEEPITVITG